MHVASSAEMRWNVLLAMQRIENR